MKELFRHHDSSLVGYYKSLLEAEGIPIVLRNANPAMSGMGTIPPQHYPNLCVTNDEDYDRARSILQKAIFEDRDKSDQESICPTCAERNPANFEVCYACGGALTVTTR